MCFLSSLIILRKVQQVPDEEHLAFGLFSVHITLVLCNPVYARLVYTQPSRTFIIYDKRNNFVTALFT